MDNLDKYLPLLLMIVVSLVMKVIGGNKKKGSATQQQPQESLDEAPVPVVQPVPSKSEILKMKKAKSLESMSRPEDIEPVFSSLGLSQIQPDESSSLVLLEESDGISSLNLTLQDTDEVKRAIIYSEILAKKYE